MGDEQSDTSELCWTRREYPPRESNDLARCSTDLVCICCLAFDDLAEVGWDSVVLPFPRPLPLANCWDARSSSVKGLEDFQKRRPLNGDVFLCVASFSGCKRLASTCVFRLLTRLCLCAPLFLRPCARVRGPILPMSHWMATSRCQGNLGSPSWQLMSSALQ